MQEKAKEMLRESLCGVFACVKIWTEIQDSLRQVKSNLHSLGKHVMYEIVQLNPT